MTLGRQAETERTQRIISLRDRADKLRGLDTAELVSVINVLEYVARSGNGIRAGEQSIARRALALVDGEIFSAPSAASPQECR
jgi:hypothetical protein